MGRPFPYYAFLIAALLWCAAIVLPPAAADSHPSLSRIGYRFFSLICHQEDSRSLHLAGHPLGVCCRCTAIYFGFLIGIILSPFGSGRVPAPVLLVWAIASMPMLIDVAAEAAGVYASTIPTRLASGLFFGAAAALILTPHFEAAFSELTSHQSDQQSTGNELKA